MLIKRMIACFPSFAVLASRLLWCICTALLVALVSAHGAEDEGAGAGAGAEVVDRSAAGGQRLIIAPATIAGPWMVLASDGTVRIFIEFPSSVAADRIQHIHLRRPPLSADEEGPQILPVRRDHQMITRPLSKPSQLLRFTIPPELTFHREVMLWLGQNREHRLPMPRLPHRDDQASLIMVGGQRWPSAADLEAMTSFMGATPQVAVLVGEGWTSRLGTGGWEASIPILVADRAADDDLADALVGPPHDWRGGIQIGHLALPVISDPTTAALHLAAFSNDWLVPLDTSGRWRIDRRSKPDQQQLANIGLLIDAAHRRHRVPLILQTAHASGFISDPLVSHDAQAVVAQGGGVRVASALADGQGALFLPDTVAIAPTGPRLQGLQSSADHLQFFSMPTSSDGDEAISMKWNRWREAFAEPEGQRSAAAEWGLSSPTEAFARWQAGDDQALAQLLWLPSASLLSLGWESDALRQLMASAHPHAQWLIRRMSAADTSLVNEWVTILGPTADAVRREVILRLLADRRRHDQRLFQQLVRSSVDAEVLRSVLATIEQTPSMPLLYILSQRLQLQAAGELAHDEDPMLAHGISHAVFDSPYLSPTPLRGLALALRESIHPMARPPIERFLERHGEQRPLADEPR